MSTDLILNCEYYVVDDATTKKKRLAHKKGEVNQWGLGPRRGGVGGVVAASIADVMASGVVDVVLPAGGEGEENRYLAR